MLEGNILSPYKFKKVLSIVYSECCIYCGLQFLGEVYVCVQFELRWCVQCFISSHHGECHNLHTLTAIVTHLLTKHTHAHTHTQLVNATKQPKSDHLSLVSEYTRTDLLFPHINWGALSSLYRKQFLYCAFDMRNCYNSGITIVPVVSIYRTGKWNTYQLIVRYVLL